MKIKCHKRKVQDLNLDMDVKRETLRKVDTELEEEGSDHFSAHSKLLCFFQASSRHQIPAK